MEKRFVTLRTVHSDIAMYDGPSPTFKEEAHGLRVINEFHPGHTMEVFYPWCEVISLEIQTHPDDEKEG